MKKTTLFLALGCAAILLASCNKLKDELFQSKNFGHDDKNSIAGYVYTLSNQAAENKVMVYARQGDGEIKFKDAYATGGAGTGAGLGSQGAVILSDNGQWLVAVNAGSNTITTMKVSGDMLYKVSTVSSEGTMPISVTMYKNLVYVLNAGGSGNIAGYTMSNDGMLAYIPGSMKPLSSAASGPAQISFTDDGSSVVVTEKATNKIISYQVNSAGMPGMMHYLNAANPTPFGFAVGKKGVIYVSEAVGGNPKASTVSSYKVHSDGSISLISGPVSANQTAACWVVVTNNGKYVYATNTGSNTVSSFKAGNDGKLSLLEAAAGGTGNNSTPIDAALSNNSQFLYVLNTGNHTIRGFDVAGNGGIEKINTVDNLPMGAVGLAAK